MLARSIAPGAGDEPVSGGGWSNLWGLTGRRPQGRRSRTWAANQFRSAKTPGHPAVLNTARSRRPAHNRGPGLWHSNTTLNIQCSRRRPHHTKPVVAIVVLGIVGVAVRTTQVPRVVVEGPEGIRLPDVPRMVASRRRIAEGKRSWMGAPIANRKLTNSAVPDGTNQYSLTAKHPKTGQKLDGKTLDGTSQHSSCRICPSAPLIHAFVDVT